jgi:hypothetical protein
MRDTIQVLELRVLSGIVTIKGKKEASLFFVQGALHRNLSETTIKWL